MTDTQEAAMKRCSKCGEAKPLEMFSRDKSRKDGFNWRCKECERSYKSANAERISIREREYRKHNLAEIQTREIAYREANRETRRKQSRAWHKANRDRQVAYRQAYHQANRETRNAATRAWAKANPDKVKAKVHARRAQIAGNGGSYTAAEMQALEAAQNGHCAYCQRTGYALHIDHILPIKQGGPNSIDNICLACRKCNLNKGNKTPQQWVNRWYLRRDAHHE